MLSRTSFPGATVGSPLSYVVDVWSPPTDPTLAATLRWGGPDLALGSSEMVERPIPAKVGTLRIDT